MRRFREEQLFKEAQIAAERLGSEIARQMKSNTTGTPVPAASGILSELRQDLFDDPFDAEFSVFDVKGEEGIARIYSVGPDGNPGTDDDLTWLVFKDGHIEWWVSED